MYIYLYYYLNYLKNTNLKKEFKKLLPNSYN